MNRSKIAALVLGTALVASVAQAQATRTWVSGVGDDANPCSRTAPCKTFAGAISKTAAGGEIDVLDPGGFGTVNITKSMTIDGIGQQAGSLNAGTNGIIINGSGINVTIRHLNIMGAGTGVAGVRIFVAGKVNIEHCWIQQSTNGINATPTADLKLNIYDTLVRNNSGEGIVIFPTGGTTQLNANGLKVYGNGQSGMNIVRFTKASISNSHFSNNGVAGSSHHGLLVQQATAFATLYECTFSGNPIGLTSTAGGTNVRISECTVTNNTTDGFGGAGAGIATWGNNYVAGNVGNEIPAGGPLTLR